MPLNGKKVAVIVLALMGLTFLHSFLPYSSANAVSLTLGAKVAVPATPTGSVPVVGGVAFYNGLEYATSYYYGTVFSINLAGSSYSNLTSHTISVLNRVFYGLAVDSVSGNLASTRRIVGNDGTKDGVSIISTSTGTITDALDGSNGSPNYQNEFDQIGYYNGNFYTAAGGVLFQIKSTSPYTVAQFSTGLGPSNTGYYGFKADGSSNLWFTEILSGKLCKFDGSTVTCYSGFSRPNDIAISGSTGYVTENNANGKIDMVNLGTGAITSQASTSGTPMGIGIIGGNVVWADNGAAGNVCILNGACVATGEHPAYLASDASGRILYSYIGSNGVGSVSLGTISTTWNSATLISQSGFMTFVYNNYTAIAPSPSSASSATTSSSSSSASSSSSSHCTSSYIVACTFTVGQTVTDENTGKTTTVTSVNNVPGQSYGIIYTSTRNDPYCNGISPTQAGGSCYGSLSY